MRFLDNVLQDFIDRAPAEMAAGRLLRLARALGGPGPDGLSLVPAGPERAVRERPGQVVEHAPLQASAPRGATRPARCWPRSAAPCPDAAERGVMERFSHKLAIAPTASISIICGGTSAGIEPIPANIYTHKTLSGSFAVKNPYLERLLEAKGQNTAAVWGSILENEGSVQHLDFLARTRRTSSRPPSRSTSAGSSTWPPTARRRSASRSR